MGKSERLLAIVLLLQARGKLTAAQLAELVEVSVRTIYRDVDTLSLAHVPISMDYGPGGGYFLPEGYRLDPASFTPREARALALGAALAESSPLLDRSGLQAALAKLEALLPEDARAELSAMAASVLVDRSRWLAQPASTQRLEALRAALWEKRRVDILYRRSDRPRSEWRTVEPLGLIEMGDRWYLAAYCLSRKGYRTFRLDRILELALRDEPADPHPDFDLRAYWEKARDRFEGAIRPLRLVLRLTPHGAYYLQPGHEVIAREADGRIVAAGPVENVDAGIAYALSLGPEVEVLEPPAVRQEVAAAAKAMAALYA
jgi:predicted DNA-binding transcriptional regulator YafY